MNYKVLYGIAGVIFLVGIFFFLSNEKDVKNYPSKGTDIIAIGDSLVRGVGASEDSKNFVSLLSTHIGESIINLGVSGNTTADGLTRLSELDKYNPKIVILLLGGNDFLRKVPIDETFQNLEKIIQNIHSRGSMVLLLGIRGGFISDKFDSRFVELSEKYNTAYVPNVLSGLLGKPEYMADAIHPNDAGYKIIESRVYPVLNKLLK